MRNRRFVLPWAVLFLAPALLGGLTGCHMMPFAEAAREPGVHEDCASDCTAEERPWCKAHNVFEDECLRCNPEAAGKESRQEDAHEEHGEHGGHGAHGERGGVLWCNGHNVAEAECAICQPQRLAALETGQGMKVRFASGEVLERAGVLVREPLRGAGRMSGHLLGETSFNKNQLALVTPLADGVVAEVHADVGDAVAAGDLLATVNAPAIAEAKAALLTAAAQVDLARRVHARERDLFEREISARQDFEQAEAALTAAESEATHARQHLLNLGLREEEVDRVAVEGAATSALPIRAPFAGSIVARNAVQGTAVKTGTALFEVADLSTLWMELSIPESRLGQVRQGAPLQARFEAFPGLAFDGELTWLAYQIDPRTRMVEARAVLDNTQGMLRAGMFGKAQVAGIEHGAEITVPVAAIQEVDGRPVVFTRIEDSLFETRLVELGAQDQRQAVVLAGLAPNEPIAVEGSYILKSEMLKARLGAGCADH